jgi:hypothetical protein
LAIAVIAFAWSGLAIAGDGPSPAATPPPASDPETHAEATPNSSTEAPAPEHAMKPDSVVTSAAVRDSVDKTPDAAATSASKEPEPAEHIENASSPPAEKPAAELSKPADSGAKAAPAKPITRAKTRALARRPSTRRAVHPPVVHEAFTEADRVSTELERTERYVGRAQKSILISKNTRAIKLFTSALDFQSDSREACKVRQYARAERLTLAARDFADRASRMVGPPREDPDYVEHVLRRTDDALDRAKDVLKNGAGQYAWSQHDELKQEQKDAWKVFKSGDVGSAYKQTLGVREGVLVLLRQLQDLPVPRETAEKAIGGAQAALEQASKELGPRPTAEAARLVRLAGDYLSKARQSYSRGSYRSALLQAKVVERHVEHAVDVGRPGSG